MSDERQKELHRARGRRHYRDNVCKGIIKPPTPHTEELVSLYLDAKLVTDAESQDPRVVATRSGGFWHYMATKRGWELTGLIGDYVKYAGLGVVSTVTTVSTTISNLFRARPKNPG